MRPSAGRADGRAAAMLGVTRDITQRHRAEAQLRKLSQTIEQAPLSVIITDLAGTIEYVNPTFCATTGYTAAEVLGQNPRLLKSGATPEQFAKFIVEDIARYAKVIKDTGAKVD